ncbi:oligosaccharyltransferase complex zeta subunit Ost5 [Schizosaccharomyces pombe]|uniref:Dolichyl-diphosphooligosaccharide--protein glycosyltransferase subunit ost5 n=1 Tax=Schizosaccharomyces pombe (strain 972 / ATCC 24843) TaxID=284812 RepID=OST5_SCHPO|nr:putative oligosaccharyltransferase complex zeta subunit Ost5 [Schizosaccharomyces pombe]G2TRU0.1 RecName: Full=Dolichyl-diphosphooligosaccharide--protein glycosyltransferase subunit ost5; Short=Oligosaccharyl transferase subunit ost5; AltName: Full=Oligosaccharyl transferase subunit zeta [Schizosaccharomyces pombe 972h-]CCD31399.1 oligosaccharyltransferase complex zeta subunit Ost5 (predicted) [Schizosaccharomyces pombe]|eukprot:NP_001343189.1 putative oligosaccharyltransferase complex zeta subunit Ost5 [Schizosaccharomyces pombe]
MSLNELIVAALKLFFYNKEQKSDCIFFCQVQIVIQISSSMFSLVIRRIHIRKLWYITVFTINASMFSGFFNNPSLLTPNENLLFQVGLHYSFAV